MFLWWQMFSTASVQSVNGLASADQETSAEVAAEVQNCIWSVGEDSAAPDLETTIDQNAIQKISIYKDIAST